MTLSGVVATTPSTPNHAGIALEANVKSSRKRKSEDGEILELRNMFKTIFGNREPPENVTQYRFLNNFSPFFSSFNSNLYDNDIVRTCIDAIAKMPPKMD